MFFLNVFNVSVRSTSKIYSHNSADETESDNEILFLVNKGGFPLDGKTWEQMWDHAARIHPDGYGIVNKIRNREDLPQVLDFMSVSGYLLQGFLFVRMGA